MQLIRENTYDNPIIIVDGHCNSGKVILMRILECMDKVEKLDEDYLFYYIPYLYKLNKIDEDVGITMLKIAADRGIYDLLIGRDINFRYGDMSSIFKYPYPLDYIKRALKNKERTEINKQIEKEKPIFQQTGHNSLSYANLFFKAFDKRIKFIYMIRNPIDIIYGIRNRGFGHRIGTDPSEIQLTYKKKNEQIPIYAQQFEDEYEKLTEIERIIRMVYHLTETDLSTYNSLSEERKSQIKFINFDGLVTSPWYSVTEIAEFVDAKYSYRRMKRTLKKEKCPRHLNIGIRNWNEEYLRKYSLPTFTDDGLLEWVKELGEKEVHMLDELIYWYGAWPQF